MNRAALYRALADQASGTPQQWYYLQQALWLDAGGQARPTPERLDTLPAPPPPTAHTRQLIATLHRVGPDRMRLPLAHHGVQVVPNPAATLPWVRGQLLAIGCRSLALTLLCLGPLVLGLDVAGLHPIGQWLALTLMTLGLARHLQGEQHSAQLRDTRRYEEGLLQLGRFAACLSWRDCLLLLGLAPTAADRLLASLQSGPDQPLPDTVQHMLPPIPVAPVSYGAGRAAALMGLLLGATPNWLLGVAQPGMVSTVGSIVALVGLGTLARLLAERAQPQASRPVRRYLQLSAAALVLSAGLGLLISLLVRA